MNKSKWIVLVVGLIILIGGFVFLKPTAHVDQGSDTAGAGDTVKVPDAVSESTAADATTKNWKSSVGDGLTFLYPAELGTSYIVAQVWPPQVYVLGEAGSLVCAPEGATPAKDGQTVQRVINKHTYCLTKVSKPGTGRVDTKYAYAFEKDKKTLALIVDLRLIDCAGYPAEKKVICEAERKGFNLDIIADKIAQSFKIGKIEAAPTNVVAPAGS